MKFTKASIEEALIAASKELGCSVIELNYTVLQHPRKGFCGLFSKEAIIEINSQIKPSTEANKEQPAGNHAANSASNHATNHAANSASNHELNGAKTHMQPAPILSAEQINKAKEELKELISFSSVAQVQCSQLECGALDIKITCDEPSNLLGKDNFKYASLDILLNHYTNINFGVHARVDVNGCLEPLIAQLDDILEQMAQSIEKSGRANSGILSPSLLNIAYEKIANTYAHKIINIKDSQNGRYICVWGQYDEHHRASCKRKH